MPVFDYISLPSSHPIPDRFDLLGKTFHQLQVVALAGQKANKRFVWKCQCSCGNTTIVEASSLRRGMTKSCGQCIQRSPIKHGLSRTRIYGIWNRMLSRCNDPKDISYSKYGGRGIIVCERWSQIENFLADMGHPPSDKHSIERINNDGNYEPDNCKWATNVEQQANREITMKFTYHGETLPLTEWVRRFGLPINAIRKRLRRGWSFKKAIETPIRNC